MKIQFKPIFNSWVAVHPNPIGVIEFIGGAGFGMLPNITYSHLLHSFYDTGYTVIAVPFPLGLNHRRIAEGLAEERDRIRASLGYGNNTPHFWVGHSLGCKYILLLEATGKICDQPSLLLAPDISDTTDILPIPGINTLLAHVLDRLNLGVQPTRKETQALVQESNLFNLTAMISFQEDSVAGTQKDSIEISDVSWFVRELEGRKGRSLLKQEIPGRHLAPVGIRLGQRVLDLEVRNGILGLARFRVLETLATEFLMKLA